MKYIALFFWSANAVILANLNDWGAKEGIIAIHIFNVSFPLIWVFVERILEEDKKK